MKDSFNIVTLTIDSRVYTMYAVVNWLAKSYHRLENEPKSSRLKIHLCKGRFSIRKP